MANNEKVTIWNGGTYFQKERVELFDAQEIYNNTLLPDTDYPIGSYINGSAKLVINRGVKNTGGNIITISWGFDDTSIVRTTEPHGFDVDDSVLITNTNISTYDGAWRIVEIISATQFRIEAAYLGDWEGGNWADNGIYDGGVDGNILLITDNGGTEARVSTTVPHGLSLEGGQNIIIVGASEAGYNTTWTVNSVLGDTEFTLGGGSYLGESTGGNWSLDI